MAIEINGDTGISGVNGSATTPAIQGTDTNTGLTFGTDTVGVVTGGTTRTTVDSSGRLLVGTSTSASAGDAQYAKLQVQGNTASASSGLVAIERGTTAANTANNDTIGAILFTDSTGGGFASITTQADGSPNPDDYPGRLMFFTTADDASSPTERMRITQNGAVCINSTDTSMNTFGAIFTPANTPTTQPSVLNFSKTHSGAVDAVVFRHNGSRKGSITFNDTSTTFTTTSDYRVKENISPLSNAATRLNQLQVYRFNFVDHPDTTVDGFIAHEAQAVVPECVIGTHNEVEVWKEGEQLPDGVSVGDNKLDEDGNTIPVYQGIDQSKLVPLLTAALQEALAKIETLETRLTALEGGTN